MRVNNKKKKKKKKKVIMLPKVENLNEISESLVLKSTLIIFIRYLSKKIIFEIFTKIQNQGFQ